ncbi:MAG: ANTAR domain-containing protein [Verrucomicrobiales bacterium]|nr:ANTAR domain-containing protein [Verrucomicrobiales bacterium]
MDSGPHSIFIAHSLPETRETLEKELKSLGHEIVGISSSCKETLEHVIANPPRLIVSGIDFPDGDGVDTLVKISESRILPSIVVTSNATLERVERAMDDHVMAYLMEPVDAVDLKPSIHVVLRRFEQFEELHQEVRELKGALSTRKKVERAKGILMAKNELTEEEAYLQLRASATKNRISMSKVADLIIDTHTGE